MAELRDIAAYLCDNYPRREPLPNSRLTKMVYLADWKSAIERGEQLTSLEWKYDSYGPYVPDVIDLAGDKNEEFAVEEDWTPSGNPKNLVHHTGASVYPTLSSEERELLDFVVESTQDLSYPHFVNLVYSTYPVFTGEQGTKLDLVSLARDYEEVKPLIGATGSASGSAGEDG